MFGNREQITKEEAKKIIKQLKAEKTCTAISFDNHMRTVEIHKMEKDPILKENLPAYTYIIFCRDSSSARKLAENLREMRYN